MYEASPLIRFVARYGVCWIGWVPAVHHAGQLPASTHPIKNHRENSLEAVVGVVKI